LSGLYLASSTRRAGIVPGNHRATNLSSSTASERKRTVKCSTSMVSRERTWRLSASGGTGGCQLPDSQFLVEDFFVRNRIPNIVASDDIAPGRQPPPREVSEPSAIRECFFHLLLNTVIISSHRQLRQHRPVRARTTRKPDTEGNSQAVSLQEQGRKSDPGRNAGGHRGSLPTGESGRPF